MFCVNCLLDCFKLKAQPEAPKCFIDDMGINTHQQKIWRDKDLQTEQKRKFPQSTNHISNGFNKVPIPGSLYASEAFTKMLNSVQPTLIPEEPCQELQMS